MNGAVLWADFSHQHRAEQIGAALQLCTDSSAEIRHLIRRSHNLNSRPVRLPSVSRKEFKMTPCYQSGFDATDQMLPSCRGTQSLMVFGRVCLLGGQE